MAAPATTKFKPDIDIHITYEDQLKINLFARYNARHEELNSKLAAKQGQIKDTEDAQFELEEFVALDDEDTAIPNLIGDVLLHKSAEDTLKSLEETVKQTKREEAEVKESIKKIKADMEDLKKQLYGKFGNHINLEED